MAKNLRLDIGAGKLDQNKVTRYKRYLGDDYNPENYLAIDRGPLPGIKVV